jgi:hypothetical protein
MRRAVDERRQGKTEPKENESRLNATRGAGDDKLTREQAET